MTYAERVTTAPDPRSAMVVLAEGIDEILTYLQPTAPRGWEGWTSPAAEAKNNIAAIRSQTVQLNVVDISEDERVVEIAPPTEEKKQKRWSFAHDTLRLNVALGDGEDWEAAYATGGPLWLYTGNRELVMSYPAELRARMVADVEEDDPQTAQEMARDVLKFAGETGPGSVAMQVAVGDVG